VKGNLLHLSEDGNDVLIMEMLSGRLHIVAGTLEKLLFRLADESIQGICELVLIVGVVCSPFLQTWSLSTASYRCMAFSSILWIFWKISLQDITLDRRTILLKTI
jgi:hypothetical protein